MHHLVIFSPGAFDSSTMNKFKSLNQSNGKDIAKEIELKNDYSAREAVE